MPHPRQSDCTNPSQLRRRVLCLSPSRFELYAARACEVNFGRSVVQFNQRLGDRDFRYAAGILFDRVACLDKAPESVHQFRRDRGCHPGRLFRRLCHYPVITVPQEWGQVRRLSQGVQSRFDRVGSLHSDRFQYTENSPLLMPKISLALFLLVISISCQPTVPKSPVIGEAFVGPMKLDIHKEILPKSPVVAIGHYGEKLQVVGQRRHFLKVRTAQGMEGWVDDRNLLDSAAIATLKELAVDSGKYPSQGLATTYDTLNVHTEPNRSSPSYLQIQAGERVDVIGHRTAPRQGAPRKPLVIAPPRPKRPTREKKEAKSKVVPPPPLPPPPKLPADWLELSRRRDPEEPDDNKPEPKPVVVAPPDDWSLIRNASGQAGWVLTRRIFMAIPDDVAQYAEGKRITSYFSLGKIDGKDTWLWTTCEPGPQDHEIEGFRVFSWNPRRKRYETTYIQRRVVGYYPVLVKGSSFSMLLDKDGKRFRQHFTLVGNRVKFDGEEAVS
jgi:hypothetical protein